MSGAVVARQAVLNRRMGLVAYELLYRGSPQPVAGERETWGNRATSEVLVNLLTERELERLVGRHPVFVNLTREFLLELPQLPLDQDRLVPEVLEDVAVDEALLGSLRRLSRRGFTIALDDFVLADDKRPLLEIADIIKLDVREHDTDSLRGVVTELKGSGVRLLAEKVETPEEFQYCRSLGFELFQGFFFARPRKVKGRGASPDRINVIRLLGRLQDPELTLEEVTDLVSRNPYLSFRLLRLINSAYFPFRKEVESVARAVTLMGLNPVRTWATWLTMAGVPDKPPELAVTTLVRAQMAASLGQSLGERPRDQHFTVGLFSTLDALLDRPLAEAVESLPLTEEVTAALLRGEGVLGRVLTVVLRYERGGWEGTAEALALPPGRIGEAYREAVAWAEGLREELG